jgi:hypothetical protein
VRSPAARTSLFNFESAFSIGLRSGLYGGRYRHPTRHRVSAARTRAVLWLDRFPQLLGFIRVVALLRQRHKDVREGGHIDAAAKDYEITYNLMRPILLRTFASLNERAKNLLAAILENALVSESFTRNDCAKWAGVGLTEVRNRLNVLVEAGLVEQLAGGKGVSYKYRVTSTKAEHPALEGLVKPDELRKLIANAKKSKQQPPPPSK